MPNDPLWEVQTRSFATKIGYDQAIRDHVGSEKVEYDWKDIPPPPHLPGWQRINFAYSKSVTDVSAAQEDWEFGYSHDKKGIDVKITSHPQVGHAALDAILDYAHRSTMIEPPWIKGPADLGTLSIMSDGPYGFNIYWAYRNLQFAVEGTDKTDALKTAYWLNSIAEAHCRTR